MPDHCWHEYTSRLSRFIPYVQIPCTILWKSCYQLLSNHKRSKDKINCLCTWRGDQWAGRKIVVTRCLFPSTRLCGQAYFYYCAQTLSSFFLSSWMEKKIGRNLTYVLWYPLLPRKWLFKALKWGRSQHFQFGLTAWCHCTLFFGVNWCRSFWFILEENKWILM